MKNDLCLSVAFMNYNYDKTSGFHPRLEKVSWCFMPSQPVRLYQGDT